MVKLPSGELPADYFYAGYFNDAMTGGRRQACCFSVQEYLAH